MKNAYAVSHPKIERDALHRRRTLAFAARTKFDVI